MNNKFKLATKRITAVAASAALVSSAVIGAPLANYPTNFVDDGEFTGTVVVGSQAAASDMTAAESLIDDLASEFSGEQDKVRIDYTMSSGNGDRVSATDDRQTLNFGVTNFGSIKETLDLDSTDLLEDGDLDNEEYSQELVMGDNAEFNYKLWTEVDATEASDGLYFDNGATFATYTLDFDSALTGDQIANDDTNVMVGESLEIMGNEFVVVALTNTSMTLIGGADKVSLGAGDSQTITFEGEEYEVTVNDASTEKAQITVNGESITIDEYDTQEVAGVSVAVTDVFSTDRTGYASLVVGGQKLEFEDNGNIKFNDEDLEDVYEEYEITSSWNGEILSVTYAVDDEILLEKGDELVDVLFDAFTLSYDGINDVDYSTLEITSDSDSVDFSGNLYNGNAIPSEFALSVDDSSENNNFQLGTEDERIFFSGSNNATVPLTNNLGSTMAGVTLTAPDSLVFDLNDSNLDIQDQIFFTQETSAEDMHLYKVTSSTDDGVDSEISFEDLIGGSTYADRNADELASDLESDTFADSGTQVTVDLSELSDDNGETSTNAALYLENELIMNFQEAENLTSTDHLIQFLYSDDAEADDETNTLDNVINLSYKQKSTDFDTDPIVLSVSGSDVGSQFEVEEDSDLMMFVDSYGTRVTIDTDDNDMVKIEVPDQEVYGEVSFNFGEASSESGSVTVDADAVESTKEDLIADGYTITDETDVATEEVEFDVEAPEMDTDVAGTDDLIVVGGPAVNAKARELMGISTYTVAQAGVAQGEGVARYFEDENSVLIYGYSAADTAAIVTNVNAGTANFE